MPEDLTENITKQLSAWRSGSPEFGELLGTIPDANTQIVYARAVRQFLEWCRTERIVLNRIEPGTIAAYIEKIDARDVRLSTEPTMREHLEAIRLLLAYVGRNARRGCCGPNCKCGCCRALRSTNDAHKSQCAC
jgi:hypothetical protein